MDQDEYETKSERGKIDYYSRRNMATTAEVSVEALKYPAFLKICRSLIYEIRAVGIW